METDATARNEPSPVPDDVEVDYDADAERTDDEVEPLPDHLDLPIETPEADALAQRRSAPSDDEAAPR